MAELVRLIYRYSRDNLALVNVSATVAILCKLETRTTPAGVRACSVDTISERTASETRRIYLLSSRQNCAHLFSGSIPPFKNATRRHKYSGGLSRLLVSFF